MNFWSPQCKKKKIKSGTRRQTARQATCATAGAVRYRGVPLLRSQPGANCLPGSGRRLSLGSAFCYWPRFGSPRSFHLCRVSDRSGGSEHLFIYFYSLNRRTNRIESNLLRLLGFRPPVASTGPSPPLSIEKVPRGEILICPFSRHKTTYIFVQTTEKYCQTMDRVAAMLVLLGLLVVSDFV